MTKSPFWKTYAALAVLGSLGAYIYFVESKREITPEGQAKREKVFSFDKAKARELAIVSGAETVKVVKEAAAWRLVSPLAATADTTEVESVLAAMEGLEREDVVAEAATALGDYGLAPPRASVTVQVEGGAPVAVEIGAKAPGDTALYAKLPGAPRVFTVPALVEGSLLKKPFDLRDRNLLHLRRDAVTEIAVRGPEDTYSLARVPGGEWSFTAPLKTRAGRWPVDGLLNLLESLRMDRVAAEAASDAGPYGLAAPLRTVTLTLEGGARQTLEIGAPAEPGTGAPGEAPPHHARVAGSSLVAVIPGALVGDLAKGRDALRAKRLLDVATYEIVRLELTSPESARRVLQRAPAAEKSGGQEYVWKRSEPDVKDVSTTVVQDALFLVGGLEVQEFVDAPGPLAQYGLEAPAVRVTLAHEGGKPAAWFEIGRKDGTLFARRPDDAAVLKLDPAKAEELLKVLSGL